MGVYVLHSPLSLPRCMNPHLTSVTDIISYHIKASNHICVCVYVLHSPHIPPLLYESTSHILGATVQMRRKRKTNQKNAAILKAPRKRKQRKNNNNNGWFYLMYAPAHHRTSHTPLSLEIRFGLSSASITRTAALSSQRCLFRPPHPTSLGMLGKPVLHIITS